MSAALQTIGSLESAKAEIKKFKPQAKALVGFINSYFPGCAEFVEGHFDPYFYEHAQYETAHIIKINFSKYQGANNFLKNKFSSENNWHSEHEYEPVYSLIISPYYSMLENTPEYENTRKLTRELKAFSKESYPPAFLVGLKEVSNIGTQALTPIDEASSKYAENNIVLTHKMLSNDNFTNSFMEAIKLSARYFEIFDKLQPLPLASHLEVPYISTKQHSTEFIPISRHPDKFGIIIGGFYDNGQTGLLNNLASDVNHELPKFLKTFNSETPFFSRIQKTIAKHFTDNGFPLELKDVVLYPNHIKNSKYHENNQIEVSFSNELFHNDNFKEKLPELFNSLNEHLSKSLTVHLQTFNNVSYNSKKLVEDNDKIKTLENYGVKVPLKCNSKGRLVFEYSNGLELDGLKSFFGKVFSEYKSAEKSYADKVSERNINNFISIKPNENGKGGKLAISEHIAEALVNVDLQKAINSNAASLPQKEGSIR